MKVRTLNVVKILGVLSGVLAGGMIAVSPVQADGFDAYIDIVPYIARATEVKVMEMKVAELQTPDYTDVNAWTEIAAADVNTCANIRMDAGKKNERVGVLLPGCAVEVLGEKNGWSQIKSGELEGYINSKLLVFGEEAKKLYEEKHELNADTKELEGALTEEAYKELKAQKAKEAREARKAQRAQQAKNGQKAEPVSATTSDLDLLAAIIECEAGGESHKGKVAVGAVIMNRIASSKFPDSISGVVYQKGQFSPVRSGKLKRVLAKGARSDCYEAAQDALNGENPIGDALFFNSGKGKGIQIGNQHFF